MTDMDLLKRETGRGACVPEAPSLQRESQSAGHHHHHDHHHSLTDSAQHRSVDGAVGTQAAAHGGRQGKGALLPPPPLLPLLQTRSRVVP